MDEVLALLSTFSWVPGVRPHSNQPVGMVDATAQCLHQWPSQQNRRVPFHDVDQEVIPCSTEECGHKGTPSRGVQIAIVKAKSFLAFPEIPDMAAQLVLCLLDVGVDMASAWYLSQIYPFPWKTFPSEKHP